MDELKRRIEKEIDELLECKDWDGRVIMWMGMLVDILKDIHEMGMK